MRKRLWAVHSLLGLVCGLALLVIGLTGSVLVFHEEIARGLYPETLLNDDWEGRERRPLPELMDKTEARFPEFWVRGWLPQRDPEARDLAYLKRRDSVDAWHILYVDPYSGEMSEKPFATSRTIYGWFVDLHYTFFADHAGMAITAALAICLCLLSLTGLYLHRSFFKSLFRLRLRQGARIIFSDLHRAVGIASLPVNLLLGFTGAYWNIAHLAHEFEEHGHEGEPAPERPRPSAIERFAAAEAAAQAHWPEFALNYVYMPTAEDGQFHLYGRMPGSHPFRSPYGSFLSIDAETAEIAYARDLREAGWWAQVVDAFEPLHFGDFGGLASKIVWCLAGLAPGGLTVSGSAIWILRRRAAKRRRPAAASGAPPAPELARRS